MTPRARRRLLIAVPVLGLPLLLLSAGIWYLASGQAIRDAQAQWRKHLPGELVLDSLRLEAVDTVSAQGLGWEDGGQKPISIRQVTITGDPFAGEVSGMVLGEPTLRLNKPGMKSWEALFAAIAPMVEGESTERRDIPLVAVRQGRLEIGSWVLDGIDVSMARQAEGRTGIQLQAQQGEASWEFSAAIGEDGSFEISELKAEVTAQALTQAVLDILPGQAENGLAAEMPALIQLSSEQLHFAADGTWHGEVTLAFASPWWGMQRVVLSGEQLADGLSALAQFEHALGSSELKISADASGQELVFGGAPLPLAEMAGARWSLPYAAPTSVDLAASALRRDASGKLSGAIRALFPDGWLGLQRLSVDEIAIDDPFALLLTGEQRQLALRLGLDSGHANPLRLLFSATETRGEMQNDAAYEVRLRGSDSPVSTATILSIAQAIGGFEDPPFMLRSMIPPQLSLATTDLVSAFSSASASPSIVGRFGVDWQVGIFTLTLPAKTFPAAAPN